jgi:hypothetical protein
MAKKPHGTLLSAQVEEEKMRALGRVFSKTDTVLVGKRIAVTVAKQGPAPSWTDGTTITFNHERIGHITSVADLIRISGLNYHELAHVMFTPRSDNPIVRSIQSKGCFRSFNILEDQRIEYLLTGLYPSTIPYLVSAVLRFCASTEQAWESNFVLTHGRRYLPEDIRKEFRNRFVKPELVPQFEAIIDEYRRLVFPKDLARAETLVVKFHQLLAQLKSNIPDPYGHEESRPVVTAGRPKSQEEQERASEAGEELDEHLDNPEDDAEDDSEDSEGEESDELGGEGTSSDGDEDGEESDDGEAGSGGDSDSDADDDLDGEGAGDSGDFDSDEDSDEDSDSDSDSETDGVGGNGAGGPSDGKDDEEEVPDDAIYDDDDFRDILGETAKVYEEDPSVKEDIASKQRAILSRGDIDTVFNTAYFSRRQVQPVDVSVARKFTQHLSKMRADSDPGWKTHQATGRINIKRYMAGASLDDMWDQWEPGNNDAMDIEATILVDTSGSMNGVASELSRALWVIKKALDSIGADTTVFAFSDSQQVVYRKHEKVEPGYYRRLTPSGGTSPLRSIVEAALILEGSLRKNRIFIVLTDGSWYYESIPNRASTLNSDSLITELGQRGVTTALAFLDSYGGSVDPHGCQISTHIQNPLSLIDFAKEIVTTAIANQNRNK